MNILSSQYSLNYKSFEIYISGCNRKCSTCFNKETWDFNLGNNYLTQIDIISDKIKDFSSLIDWIWILGGEPLDNEISNLEDLLIILKKLNKPIVLFTSYYIEEVPNNIKKICNFIKCGPYLEEYNGNNTQYNITVSSTNQKIYKQGVDYNGNSEKIG